MMRLMLDRRDYLVILVTCLLTTATPYQWSELQSHIAGALNLE